MRLRIIHAKYLGFYLMKLILSAIALTVPVCAYSMVSSWVIIFNPTKTGGLKLVPSEDQIYYMDEGDKIFDPYGGYVRAFLYARAILVHGFPVASLDKVSQTVKDRLLKQVAEGSSNSLTELDDWADARGANSRHNHLPKVIYRDQNFHEDENGLRFINLPREAFANTDKARYFLDKDGFALVLKNSPSGTKLVEADLAYTYDVRGNLVVGAGDTPTLIPLADVGFEEPLFSNDIESD